MTNSEHYEEVLILCFEKGLQDEALTLTANTQSISEAIIIIEALLNNVHS